MSAVGFALVAALSLSWAALDAIRKSLSGLVAPLPLLVLLDTCLLPIFAAWWIASGGEISDPSGYALYGGASLGLQLVANILFLSALRASPLSLTIPFLGLTPAFATLGGALLGAETPSPAQLLGVSLVVGGALVLGSAPPTSSEASEASEQPRPRLLAALAREPGSRMMIGVALCWAATINLDKQALRCASLPVHAFVQLLGITLVVLVYLAARGRLAELKLARNARRQLAFAALVFGLAFALQLTAIQSVLVAVVETTKRAVGLLSAVIVGALWFEERVGPMTLVGVALLLVGVVLVML